MSGLSVSVSSPPLLAPPQMQLYFNTPADWNKRIQLRLSGEPSLTLPVEKHRYGKVRTFREAAPVAGGRAAGPRCAVGCPHSCWCLRDAAAPQPCTRVQHSELARLPAPTSSHLLAV